MIRNSCVLVFNDLHLPFQHPDALDFLFAIKKHFNPDRVIINGDYFDMYAINSWGKSPSVANGDLEIDRALDVHFNILDEFHRVDLVFGNHTEGRLLKSQTSSGMPSQFLRSFQEVLKTPDTWNFHNRLVITLSDGKRCCFQHAAGANAAAVAAQWGMNFSQGHYHNKFIVQYIPNPDGVFWGMTTGCLINYPEIVYRYTGMTHKSEPALGAAIILDGQPKLLPLLVDKRNRWIKEIR